MTIRKVGSVYKIDISCNGKRKKSTATTEAAAEILERQLYDELKYGASSDPKQKEVWTIKQAFEHCCDYGWSGGRSAMSTIPAAKAVVNFFGPHRRLDEIDVEGMDRLVTHLAGLGNGDATINRKLATLSKMFTEAHKRGRVAAKPPIPKRKERKGRIRFITPEEEAQIIQTLTQWGKDDYLDFLLILLDTGMRKGELLKSLTKRDIDFKENIISVWFNKADHPRSIPMTTRVQSILQRRCKLSPDVLFPHPNHWGRDTWMDMKSLMGLSEDEQFVPHCLRHTCASRLVQGRVPLKVVQEWLGHKSIEMTLRYSHLSPTSLHEAVGALEPEKKLMVVK